MELPDPFDRVGAVEFELVRQKQATNDLLDMMDALKGSIDALTANKNASSSPQNAPNTQSRPEAQRDANDASNPHFSCSRS
jgi:hypothetical protein